MTLGKTFLGGNIDPRPPGPTTRGSILIQGGQMSMPELHIGQAATGTVTVAGGYLSNSITVLAETHGAFGSLSITGGTYYISSSLSAGTNGATAQVSVTGGALLVTNAAGNATTILNGASLFHGAGVFKTDNLILTNGGNVITVSNYAIGGAAGTTNVLALSGGSSLTISNAALGIGNDGTTSNGSGTATATLSNATVSATVINLGSTAGGLGTLSIQTNAAVTVGSNLVVVSGSLSATSSVTVSGGTLTASNGTIAIGPTGSGQMTISAGAVTASKMKLGGSGSGASGTLTILPGGRLNILSLLSANAIINGGCLAGTGGTLIIGEDHPSELINTGEATNFSAMYVGYSSNFTGMFTNFGLVTVTTNLIVGDCASNAVGIVWLGSGSALYVTNAAHTAVLDVRNGTLLLNSGAMLVVDNLILTNACGRFLKNGGMLVTTNVMLDPNLDADGDGQSNTNEMRAGTDPLDPDSNLRLLGASVSNNNVRVDWTTVGGHSYVVQISTGSLATGFRDLSLTNMVLGTNEGATNFIHVSGATNRAGYYRVRLGP